MEDAIKVFKTKLVRKTRKKEIRAEIITQELIRTINLIVLEAKRISRFQSEETVRPGARVAERPMTGTWIPSTRPTRRTIQKYFSR